MKRWAIYTAGSIFIGLLSACSCLYLKYEPNRHFEHLGTPILSVPASSTQALPQSDKQNVNNTESLKDPESAPSAPVPGSNPSTPQAKTVKAFNVLILGIDAREEEISRSDVMMLLHIIPAERKVNIISIPRDTRVNIEGVGYTKINHAHILGEAKGGTKGGTMAAVQVVSNFFSVPINYYMKTNFEGFENVIDAIGGVDVDVEQDLYLTNDPKTVIAKGKQHINGELALSLVRERYAFPDGDFGRQAEQSKILKNVAQEILKPEHIGELAALLMKVKKDIVDTNFDDSDLVSLAWLFKGMTGEDFTYKQVPGQSGYEMDPLVQKRLYYWIPDMEAVTELSDTLLRENPS